MESLETPHVSYLYACQCQKCAPNSIIIAKAVDDAVRNLGINRSFFCLLLSDATKYMIAASITLKSLYPSKDQYECLVELIENMESAKYTIKEAEQAIQELDSGEDTCNINQYIKKECKTMTFLKY